MKLIVFSRNALLGLFLMSAVALCDQPGDKVDLRDEESPVEQKSTDWIMVVHGGAGVILPENISEEKERDIKAALNRSLKKGSDILERGGTAMDAIEAVIMVLEDDPNFNAGKGAVFNADGINELDASIMDGQNLNAGAVSGIRTIKNPILAARAVMEHSEHVMLSGEGADRFAAAQGLETVEGEYFYTERRYQSLQRAKERESKHGTVGAVALDKYGNIAAGTSTGGMTNKKYNRIGDAPIIGAGTYADNATCGVSCTGHGEYFIRHAVAHDLSARMAYGGQTLEEAAHAIIHGTLKESGGDGGLIAVDKDGNYVLEFNTPGMYRGMISPDTSFVKLYQ